VVLKINGIIRALKFISEAIHIIRKVQNNSIHLFEPIWVREEVP